MDQNSAFQNRIIALGFAIPKYVKKKKRKKKKKKGWVRKRKKEKVELY